MARILGAPGMDPAGKSARTVRLRYDPKTIAYMERRRTEGLSKKDVLRCPKRFIAREVYNDLRTDLLKPPKSS